MTKPKLKKGKRKKKDNARIRVLGVEAVSRRKGLDKFGHLEDSDTNLQGQGFDEFTNYMKKMGVRILYQKETYGKALKSNLKPRLGAKKRGLNVRWNLEGLDVKDETNAKKLSQKENMKESSTSVVTTNSILPSLDDDGPSLNFSSKRDSVSESAVSQNGGKSQGEGDKPLDLRSLALILQSEHLSKVNNLENLATQQFGLVKKLKKSSNVDLEASKAPSSKSEKRKQKLKQELRAMTSTEVNPDYSKNHDSDEEIRNLQNIANKKIEVINREKEKVADLIAQQKIVSDYQKDIDSKKNFFVEITPKQKTDKKKRVVNDPQDTIDKMVSNYERVHGKEAALEKSPTRRGGSHKRKKSVYDIHRE